MGLRDGNDIAKMENRKWPDQEKVAVARAEENTIIGGIRQNRTVRLMCGKSLR